MIKNILNYFLILLIITVIPWLYIKHSREVNRLKSNLTRSNKEILKQKKKNKLAVITNAKEVDSIQGIYFAQKRETIKWRDLFFEIEEAEQEIIKTGQIKVSFADSNKCAKVKGYTLTKTDSIPAYSEVDFTIFPISIERDFMPIEGQLIEIITPENDCIEFVENEFLIPPDLLRYEKPRGFGWNTFLIGGITGILIMEVFK